MKISFSILGHELWCLEVEKDEASWIFEEEEEEIPESTVICWNAEEHADYTVYPPNDIGVRTVFEPRS
jgi:hypothetical protein